MSVIEFYKSAGLFQRFRIKRRACQFARLFLWISSVIVVPRILAVASNNILYVVVCRINDALFSPVQTFTFHCRVLLLTPSKNICLSENLLLLYFVHKLCHTILIARCARCQSRSRVMKTNARNWRTTVVDISNCQLQELWFAILDIQIELEREMKSESMFSIRDAFIWNKQQLLFLVDRFWTTAH